MDDTPRDSEPRGRIKDELQDLLNQYSSQWAKQKGDAPVAVPAVAPRPVAMDDTLSSDGQDEVIDDVIADVDSGSADNSFSTENLMEGYAPVLPAEKYKSEYKAAPSPAPKVTRFDVDERRVPVSYPSRQPMPSRPPMQDYSAPSIDIIKSA